MTIVLFVAGLGLLIMLLLLLMCISMFFSKLVDDVNQLLTDTAVVSGLCLIFAYFFFNELITLGYILIP